MPYSRSSGFLAAANVNVYVSNETVIGTVRFCAVSRRQNKAVLGKGKKKDTFTAFPV